VVVDDEPEPDSAEVGGEESVEAWAIAVENVESMVEVTIELVGAIAMPLLVGVTTCCDTKWTEVMKMVVWTSLDNAAAVDAGTNSVATSNGCELDAADERRFCADVDEVDAALVDGVGSAEIGAFELVVATSVSEVLPESICGQPEELHGSTEQQP